MRNRYKCDKCKTSLTKEGGVNIMIKKFDGSYTTQGEIDLLYCNRCAEKVITGIGQEGSQKPIQRLKLGRKGKLYMMFDELKNSGEFFEIPDDVMDGMVEVSDKWVR